MAAVFDLTPDAALELAHQLEEHARRVLKAQIAGNPDAYAWTKPVPVGKPVLASRTRHPNTIRIRIGGCQ